MFYYIIGAKNFQWGILSIQWNGNDSGAIVPASNHYLLEKIYAAKFIANASIRAKPSAYVVALKPTLGSRNMYYSVNCCSTFLIIQRTL